MKNYKIKASIIGLMILPGFVCNATGRLQKAKLDLISHIESIVNIEICRKDIQSPKTAIHSLPHSCDKIEYLSKYGFTKQDSAAILDYLTTHEEQIANEAKVIVDTYKIKSLGKMFLSKKCVLNRELVDMDKYLAKIQSFEKDWPSDDEARVPATSSNNAKTAPLSCW